VKKQHTEWEKLFVKGQRIYKSDGIDENPRQLSCFYYTFTTQLTVSDVEEFPHLRQTPAGYLSSDSIQFCHYQVSDPTG
jgi:hypothetical protein